MNNRIAFSASVLLLASAGVVSAQEMGFEEYEPESTLVVPENPVTSARFPFVDVHNHQSGGSRMTNQSVDAVVAEMDKLNMAVMVNLSGGSGDRLKHILAKSKARHPDRFAVFANPSYDGINDPGYAEKTAAQFEADVKAGAQGLKIFKSLGMYVFDPLGRVRVDDSRLDPLWAKAGELGVPVLIHVGDPAQFWLPHDGNNERWLELKQKPRRIRTGEPSFDQLIKEQVNVYQRHPNTTFIIAHFMWMANDLDRLGGYLDALPNTVVEMGAIIYDPGRQPRHARAFFDKYQDRILMGKDTWAPEEYYTYFRVLETADEYFPYYRKRHAFWRLYGLDLSDEVLQKVYYKNAMRLIPGVNPKPISGR
ncbi:MAG: amidohydrolase family protein [Opitutaceae bacterium]|tara:strand:- start:18514 stop:19608 length:1095 start_codon:yes stop_codon:yes gene_type:complete